MAIIIRDVTSVFQPVQSATAANSSLFPFYGSLQGSNNYFASLLHGEKWEYLRIDRKVKALISASKRIDQLNFAGTKTDASQPLQFPRGTDTLVPVEIEEATYEVALALLKGIDPDTERDNLSATVQAYGSVRTEYDRTSLPPYIVAGIPSQTAWIKLLPFLEARRVVKLSRTD